jgi:uncharacterized membrane protein YgcG
VGVLVKRLRDAVDGLLLAAIAGDRSGGDGNGGGGGSTGAGSGGGSSGGGGAKVVETIRRLLAEAEEQAERG